MPLCQNGVINAGDLCSVGKVIFLMPFSIAPYFCNPEAVFMAPIILSHYSCSQMSGQ